MDSLAVCIDTECKFLPVGRRCSGLMRGMEAENPNQCVSHFGAWHDQIDKTMFKDRFGFLQIGGNGSSDGFFNYPRACKADGRPRFSNVNVAQRCEASENTCGSRIRQHGNKEQGRVYCAHRRQRRFFAFA